MSHLILTLYGLGTRPEEIVADLQRTARDLWYVREKYFHLISDMKSGAISDEEVIRQRNGTDGKVKRNSSRRPTNDK